MTPQSNIKPIVNDDEILAFVHSLTGERKHDIDVCAAHGIPRFVCDVLRRVFGKIRNKKYFLPDDLKASMIKEYRSGLPIKQIAKNHGLSVGSVYSVLSLNKVERNRQNEWSKIQSMRLVRMRDVQKLTWREIGEYFGKSPSACFQKYHNIKSKEI